MKKWAALLSAAIMMTTVAFAGAENTSEKLFSGLEGQVFEFSSGVGAWSTEMTVGENGAFTGSFHDSEMGETGEGYPDGTVYGCAFHGLLSDPAPVDEYAWTAKITLEQDEGQVPEAIEEGIRYVTAAPYGLEKAQTVVLFLPGTPVDRLPEGFLFWSHLADIAPEASAIPYYALWSEADEAGFISAVVSAVPEGPVMGGWTPAEDPTVTAERQALLDRGLEGLLGVNYLPAAYLGSQIVAGTNHAFLCRAAAVVPGAQVKYAIVYLYEDLQGNVSLLNIADFDIGSLCTYGGETAGSREAGNALQGITGNIADGCYVLTVPQDGTGEWRADEGTQEGSAVRLAASGVENGLFTARYEAAGDGEAAVTLRHFNGHNACDAIHSFTLLVKNGRVQEVTGGSFRASPDEAELDPFFSGEWLEKETQFTHLEVTKNAGGGWDVELMSPVSHGAWVLRATAYYDCDREAFVYSDGVKYDLAPGEATLAGEGAEGLCGTLKFAGSEDALELLWQSTAESEAEAVVFARAPGLPVDGGAAAD